MTLPAKKISLLFLFSMSMGLLETAVVIYLRKIYYPAGFQFPLVNMDSSLIFTEILREAATIVMLLTISFLSGNNKSQKFSFFIFSFAVWDLSYYFFLKVLINWPESILTWDALFLIPVPWLGPVLAPCLVSVTMIIFSLKILFLNEKGINTKFNSMENFFLILGTFILVISFTWNYLKFHFMSNSSISDHINIVNSSMIGEMSSYIPSEFNWSLFLLGEIVLIYAINRFVKRINSFF